MDIGTRTFGLSLIFFFVLEITKKFTDPLEWCMTQNNSKNSHWHDWLTELHFSWDTPGKKIRQWIRDFSSDHFFCDFRLWTRELSGTSPAKFPLCILSIFSRQSRIISLSWGCCCCCCCCLVLVLHGVCYSLVFVVRVALCDFLPFVYGDNNNKSNQ